MVADAKALPAQRFLNQLSKLGSFLQRSSCHAQRSIRSCPNRHSIVERPGTLYLMASARPDNGATRRSASYCPLELAGSQSVREGANGPPTVRSIAACLSN